MYYCLTELTLVDNETFGVWHHLACSQIPYLKMRNGEWLHACWKLICRVLWQGKPQSENTRLIHRTHISFLVSVA